MGEPAVLQNKTSCWICFNNEHNITLTKLNGEHVLKHFKTYLDILIIIESFENETPVSCCNYCYESVRQLTNLEEQVEKLKKEISDFSLLFSKTVLYRRTLVESEKDRSANILTPEIEKCFKIQSDAHRDSIVVLENAIVKREVNESVSKEQPSDFHEENDDLLTNSFFDTVEDENVTKDESEDGIRSNDEIEDKYSDDETFSKMADTVKIEILPNQQMSTTNAHGVQIGKTIPPSDLVKSVKMPMIQSQRYLPDRSKNTPKSDESDDGAGEESIKCQKALDEPNYPNNGSNTISKELPFKCSEIGCSESFKTKWVLERHQKTHTGERPYKCLLCSKSFTQKICLTQHERIHSGEKPYKCHLCEKSFTTSTSLSAHTISHSGSRPFKCSFCEKSFKSSSNLSAHETIHSEKTPYKCSFCEKSFKLSYVLKKHEAVHSEKKPYKCSLCEKSFRRRGNLKEHARIHTGERPLKCSFCSKSFTHSSNLKRHEMTHTGEKPHKCSSCGITFRRRDRLNDHYNQMHGETEKNEEYVLS